VQLNVEHGKLRSDVGIVRAYGEEHPEAWVDLRFENEPSVRIVALFTGDELHVHDEALHNLVAHPDQLELRWSPYPRTRLEEIEAEIRRLATSGESGTVKQWGLGQGVVNVVLRASEELLAADLHERYGDALELAVGFFRYPEKTPRYPLMKPPGERPPLLPAEVAEVSTPEGLTVDSGNDLLSALLTHNNTAEELVVETNGQVTARVVDPETGEPVGGFTGAQHLPRILFRIAPSESRDIPLLIGTASFVQRLGYALPPGRWSIETTLRITNHGAFRTPLLPERAGRKDDQGHQGHRHA
jgi:hypothetical protein